MKLQMNAVHFNADEKLINFVEKKTEKLQKLYSKIIDAEIFLRLDKKESRDNKIIEIKLNIPGTQLFAKDQADTFEAATEEAVEALRRQLKKFKEKQYSH